MNMNENSREKVVSVAIIFISMVLMAGAIFFIIVRPSMENGSPVPPETAVMPDLVGYSFEEVRSAYADYFEIIAESREYSDVFPEGAILSQDIAAGEEFYKGSTTVKAIVSLGAKPNENTASVTEITAPKEEAEVSEAEAAETEITETEISESEVSAAEEAFISVNIKNPPAEFESLIPEDELDLTVTGLEIPYDRGEDLKEELYGILRRKGADAGFLYYDIQTGGSIEYNADEKFSSGSIIKAIYARSILDNIDLDAKYEMTEELLNSPYELVNGMPVGTMFTAGELIEAALVKSDNTAYKMLYHYLGYESFNRYAASLGLPQRMTEDNYWFRMTARETASYLKEIYNFTDQHKNGPLMMKCMSNAEYRDMFSSALPGKNVAEKYGYLPQEGFYTLGDCAIISGDTDYIMIMYMRGTSDPPNTQPFQEAAKLMDELHELIKQYSI